MDETWKLSKGRSRSTTTTSRSSTSKNHNKQQQQQYQYDQQQEPHLLKSYSQRPSTSNRSPPYNLPKSFSQRSSSKSRSSAKQASSSRYGGYADSSDLMGCESEKGSTSSSSIGKKCGSLAREQKARFYIIRRCVAMLVCWHKHVDDS